jgi:hypothetical protein
VLLESQLFTSLLSQPNQVKITQAILLHAAWAFESDKFIYMNQFFADFVGTLSAKNLRSIILKRPWSVAFMSIVIPFLMRQTEQLPKERSMFVQHLANDWILLACEHGNEELFHAIQKHCLHLIDQWTFEFKSKLVCAACKSSNPFWGLRLLETLNVHLDQKKWQAIYTHHNKYGAYLTTHNQLCEIEKRAYFKRWIQMAHPYVV